MTSQERCALAKLRGSARPRWRRGRGFNPHRQLMGVLLTLVEHLPSKQDRAGSIPVTPSCEGRGRAVLPHPLRGHVLAQLSR